MKKAVSIALFGDNWFNYAQYSHAFVLAHLNLFPITDGWTLCVYLDDVVSSGKYGKFFRVLADAGLVQVSNMGSAILTKAMLWRMAPVFDGNFDYVFCRDLDACPMPRDRAVCDQFIGSGLVVHTCHDSRSHAGIMGGLCGFKAAEFRDKTNIRSMSDLYETAAKTDAEWSIHGTDQNVLARIVDKTDGPSLLEHRYGGWTAGAPGKTDRVAASYFCPAWSTPTPDVGVSKLANDLSVHADRLAGHLGAAGYDHEAAVKFWNENGDQDVAVKVVEAGKVLWL